MNSALAEKRLPQIQRLADPCRICPKACGAKRLQGEIGFCGAGTQATLFMEYLHWAEDADIVPAQTMYLNGCNLACTFCQTGEEQEKLPSTPLTPDLFRLILDRGWKRGARFVNVLGGEPTVNLPALLELFAEVGDFPNLVWNTNLYGTAETFELLNGIADVYMADLKFGNSKCAANLAGADDAGEVAKARAAEIFARTPEALIARHLVMPGHFDCCTRPVLEWVARTLPGVRVSLKTVFMPPARLSGNCLEKRFLSQEEADRAKNLAKSLGLRLTKDAEAPAPAPEKPSDILEDGNEIIMDAVISPEGRIYMRHIVRRAAETLQALAKPENHEEQTKDSENQHE